MTAAVRIAPKQFFTPEEWAPFARKSTWRGPALLVHAWLVIFAAGAMALKWPLTLPLAVMIIGARQLGLGILLHDGAHRALHPNARINDFLGEWLTGGGMAAYRTYHLAHHRNVQQPDDPDLGLSSPFPVTGDSLRRKLLRDLTGQTYYKQRWSGLVSRLRARRRGEPLTPILAQAFARNRRFLLGMAVTVAATAPFGYGWAWFALWLLPQATWLPLISRVRNIAEHACIAQGEADPLRQARTTRAGPLARALLAPYWVNYHCEHHMFMHVPCHQLPRLHRMLAAKSVTERMLTAKSYAEVLSLAASKPQGEAPERNPTPEERGVRIVAR